MNKKNCFRLTGWYFGLFDLKAKFFAKKRDTKKIMFRFVQKVHFVLVNQFLFLYYNCIMVK